MIRTTRSFRRQPIIEWYSTSRRNEFRDQKITLDALRLFGEFSLSANLWSTLKVFNLWLEPLLLSQWEALSQNYLLRQRRSGKIESKFQTRFAFEI